MKLSLDSLGYGNEILLATILIWIGNADGGLLGILAPPAPALRPINLNNQIQGLLTSVLGGPKPPSSSNTEKPQRNKQGGLLNLGGSNGLLGLLGGNRRKPNTGQTRRTGWLFGRKKKPATKKAGKRQKGSPPKKAPNPPKRNNIFDIFGRKPKPPSKPKQPGKPTLPNNPKSPPVDKTPANPTKPGPDPSGTQPSPWEPGQPAKLVDIDLGPGGLPTTEPGGPKKGPTSGNPNGSSWEGANTDPIDGMGLRPGESSLQPAQLVDVVLNPDGTVLDPSALP